MAEVWTLSGTAVLSRRSRGGSSRTRRCRQSGGHYRTCDLWTRLPALSQLSSQESQVLVCAAWQQSTVGKPLILLRMVLLTPHLRARMGCKSSLHRTAYSRMWAAASSAWMQGAARERVQFRERKL